MVSDGNLVDLLFKINDIYCEKDFLIHGEKVQVLLLKYQQLNLVRKSVASQSGSYVTALHSDYNGYKSLENICKQLVEIATSKAGEIVRKVANVNEVNKYVSFWTKAFDSLNQIMEMASDLVLFNPENCLFPANADCKSEKIVELSKKIMEVDATPFYGDIQSFHLKGDCRMFTKFLHYAIIFYGERVHFNLKSLKGFMNNLGCLFSEEKLSERIVKVSKEIDVGLAKSFYSLGESYMTQIVKPVPCIKVSKIIKIPITILKTRKTVDLSEFMVPLPVKMKNSKDHVPATFICNFRSRGMIDTCCSISSWMRDQPRDTLMFHIHGGGFIAQSPLSHIDYLHQWSKELDIPVLSIDYTLAPEASYPRAIQEVFYSYCWTLEHAKLLGWNGNRIIVSGDSAGGNMGASLVLQCIQNGIRLPDGLQLSYACLLAQFYPSPSRLMMLLDPLLMVGILSRCINAYKDTNYLQSLPRTLEDELRLGIDGTTDQDILLSPLLASKNLLKQFPPTLFVTTEADPCLDENIQFRANLINAGVPTELKVISGLPHGFLAFCNMSKECQQGVGTVIETLRSFITNKI